MIQKMNFYTFVCNVGTPGASNLRIWPLSGAGQWEEDGEAFKGYPAQTIGQPGSGQRGVILTMPGWVKKLVLGDAVPVRRLPYLSNDP